MPLEEVSIAFFPGKNNGSDLICNYADNGIKGWIKTLENTWHSYGIPSSEVETLSVSFQTEIRVWFPSPRSLPTQTIFAPLPKLVPVHVQPSRYSLVATWPRRLTKGPTPIRIGAWPTYTSCLWRHQFVPTFVYIDSSPFTTPISH